MRWIICYVPYSLIVLVMSIFMQTNLEMNKKPLQQTVTKKAFLLSFSFRSAFASRIVVGRRMRRRGTSHQNTSTLRTPCAT